MCCMVCLLYDEGRVEGRGRWAGEMNVLSKRCGTKKCCFLGGRMECGVQMCLEMGRWEVVVPPWQGHTNSPAKNQNIRSETTHDKNTDRESPQWSCEQALQIMRHESNSKMAAPS